MKWKALTRVIVQPVIRVGCQEKWELKGNECLKSGWANKMESFDIPAPAFLSSNYVLSRLKSMPLKRINPHNLAVTQYWPGHITDFMRDGEYTSWKIFLLWGCLVVGEVNINIGGERRCRGKQSHWNVELTGVTDGHLTHCHNQIGQKNGNFRFHEIMQTAVFNIGEVHNRQKWCTFVRILPLPPALRKSLRIYLFELLYIQVSYRRTAAKHYNVSQQKSRFISMPPPHYDFLIKVSYLLPSTYIHSWRVHPSFYSLVIQVNFPPLYTYYDAQKTKNISRRCRKVVPPAALLRRCMDTLVHHDHWYRLQDSNHRTRWETYQTSDCMLFHER